MTLVLVLSVAFAQGLSAQRAPIGFVLSLDGKWLSDGQPIQVGQELLAGSTISLPLASAAAVGAGRSITIILVNSQREPHSCTTLETCRAGFKLPSSLNQPTTAWSRLADAFHLIFKRPDRYVVALSRGGDDRTVNLRDGVLEIDAGKIDVAPLFQGIDAGRYMLRFRGMPTDDAPRGQASTLAVEWKPTHASTGLTTRLTPGLYKVNLFPASPPDADPIGGEAWILLDTPSRYARSRAAFQDAIAIADSWGRDVPARDRRLFLHACLDQLAGQIR